MTATDYKKLITAVAKYPEVWDTSLSTAIVHQYTRDHSVSTEMQSSNRISRVKCEKNCHV